MKCEQRESWQRNLAFAHKPWEKRQRLGSIFNWITVTVEFIIIKHGRLEHSKEKDAFTPFSQDQDGIKSFSSYLSDRWSLILIFGCYLTWWQQTDIQPWCGLKSCRGKGSVWVILHASRCQGQRNGWTGQLRVHCHHQLPLWQLSRNRKWDQGCIPSIPQPKASYFQIPSKRLS